MTLHDRIKRLLRQANALTLTEIAMEVGAHRVDTVQALHELQDADEVILRDGFCRIAEKAREK